MRHPLLNEYYSYSDFFNYGYWLAGTETQEAACANLLEKLLGFIPDKTGTMLAVAWAPQQSIYSTITVLQICRA